MIDFHDRFTALAPLAGFSDLPFRRIAKKFGADLTVSEMINVNALTHNSKKTLQMLQKDESETPYSIQIAGNNTQSVKEAVLLLNEIEGIDCIDLNCGCPVPKVVKQGSGSALLQDLPLLQDIVATIKEYSNKEYTSVKFRLGFNDKYPDKIALAAQEGGADFLAIHGRTRAGAYKAPVDYEAIKLAKESVAIPVIANGDITNYQVYKEVIKITGCDGVMIGRGAIGNPWIFYQIKHDLETLSKEKILEIVLEHLQAMVDFYGEHGIPNFRKHLHLYSKSFPNARAFRDKINRIEKLEELLVEIKDYFL
jgi:tRNA-dihydrouridine synthase B